MSHRAQVITVSDGVSAGTREDVSGPALHTLLTNAGFEVAGPEVVPDRQLGAQCLFVDVDSEQAQEVVDVVRRRHR